MTVRVDELLPRPRARHSWFRKGSCHLTADSEEELHDFAARLGLKRAWFQPHRVLPHYDLTSSRRAKALQLGAVFVPARDQIKATAHWQQLAASLEEMKNRHEAE